MNRAEGIELDIFCFSDELLTFLMVQPFRNGITNLTYTNFIIWRRCYSVDNVMSCHKNLMTIRVITIWRLP